MVNVAPFLRLIRVCDLVVQLLFLQQHQVVSLLAFNSKPLIYDFSSSYSRYNRVFYSQQTALYHLLVSTMYTLLDPGCNAGRGPSLHGQLYYKIIICSAFKVQNASLPAITKPFLLQHLKNSCNKACCFLD